MTLGMPEPTVENSGNSPPIGNISQWDTTSQAINSNNVILRDA